MTIFNKTGTFLTKWANIIAGTARATAKNFGSTRIPKSIKVTTPKISLTSAEITVYADSDIAPHAAILEHGAKAHTIDAKNAPNLIFEGTKAFKGRLIIIPSVDHPGMKARPFMSTAVRKHRKNLLRAARKEFGDAFRLSIIQNSRRV